MAKAKSRERACGMSMYQPATDWRDGCPVGNGRIGATLYGNIVHDVVMLNHEALWVPLPKPVLPDVSGKLPDLRALLAAGRYKEAEGFLERTLREAGYPMQRPGCYQPAFDLCMHTQTGGPFSDYRRSVDFRSGIAAVEWTDAGVNYRREVFVCRGQDVVAMRISASRRGRLTVRLALAPHDAAAIPKADAAAGCDPNLTFDSRETSDTLSVIGAYSDGSKFGGLARVFAAGGRSVSTGQGVQVTGADSIVVLLKLFVWEEPASALARLADEVAALAGTYPALRRKHVAAHDELFNRMQLDLGAGDSEAVNERLLIDAYNGDVPTALIQRMFDYGRHLLVSSSAGGAWPANLQGIWNGFYQPPWRSDYHNDENVQMNYWQALPGNLAEAALPFFDYYESMVEDYRVNARNLYGCRGIYIPISQTTHGLIGPGVWCNWTAAAGWLAQLFYDYYLFTGDKEFLRARAIPFMKEAALFYEDFLFESPDGRAVFAPSLSPENRPQRDEAGLVTINATMDVAVARELLTNLCAACDTLGIEREAAGRWRALLAKLPAYQVNADGAIREWIHDALPDNYHHRHQSHIYPLFPGREVTPETAGELFEACRVAVEKRLVVGLTSQTGWSLSHMANIYARLGEGDRALECLELLTRSCVGPNLYTYHNDWRAQGLTLGWFGGDRCFQIDANFGLTAAVLEMLVFSAPGWVKLLPALPKKWTKGSAQGIACRGGITLDIEWDIPAGRLDARITSRTSQQITLKLPAAAARIQCAGAETCKSEHGAGYREIGLIAGKMARLAIFFVKSSR
ncbi:MAG: glycoside hydrolase family 95 protein [Planctomycetaceae bacterium]